MIDAALMEKYYLLLRIIKQVQPTPHNSVRP